jgi:hypothetical protein
MLTARDAAACRCGRWRGHPHPGTGIIASARSSFRTRAHPRGIRVPLETAREIPRRRLCVHSRARPSIDSPLEEERFEPSVPRGIDDAFRDRPFRLCGTSRSDGETDSFCERDRRFESASSRAESATRLYPQSFRNPPGGTTLAVAVEIDGVPVHDGCGNQAEIGGAEALISNVRPRISPWRRKNTARRTELLASPLFSPAWLCWRKSSKTSR